MVASSSMMTSALAFVASCTVALADANELNLSDGQADASPISTVEIHPPLPTALTSEDLPGLAGEAVFGAEAVADIVGRRRLGLPIPETYYEQCHFWVNAVRSREGLPALQRWKDFESCTDDMAAYDYDQYNRYRRAHAAMMDGYGCDFFATGATAFSQNSCPMWGNDVTSIKDCTVMMWDEKTEPGVDPGTLNCLGASSAECGHYYNLRGGSSPGMYNKYDKVACGFYVDPETERLYINQNFGGGNNFLCGGDENTRPQTNRLVEDCVGGPLDYSGCDGLSGIQEPLYYEMACVLVDCDLEYDGPCENTLVNGFDACEYFDITEPADCTAGRGWRYNSPDSEWYPFAKYCRIPCKTCSCEDKLDGVYGTRAPTPPPTAHCDDVYDGPCEDADPDLCSLYGIADIAPCSYNWAFSGTGTLVVDSCRKSCKMCGCEALPAPTPAPVGETTPAPTDLPTRQPTDNPTPFPTQQPTDNPTPFPTRQPTQDPTKSLVPSPTLAPVEDPTNSPVPSPTAAPVEDPTNAPVPSPTSAPVEPTTPSPTFLVTDPEKCPWLTPTDERAKLECQNGEFCNGWADGWSCCKSRGGRKRCPVDMPKMCVDTCNGTNCCGGDHCCETDCATAGGELPCEKPEPTESPTDQPTDSPTQSPTPSPTETPALPCDDLQVGVPGGVRTRVEDRETACECATQCTGKQGFVHFPRKNRCWCVESFNGDVSDSDATGRSRKFYQLVSQIVEA